MFTGIIKHVGTVESIESMSGFTRLIIQVESAPSDLSVGDSVAINGACLTVVEFDSQTLSFDVIQETLDRTTLSGLEVGFGVNVEFSMRLNDFVGGHLVSGHVDFTSELLEIDKNQYWFSIDKDFSKFLVEKGSVSVNGVSLTVNQVLDDKFRVDLIPETIESTNFNLLVVSCMVNIEIDLIARYLSKLI
jgi:riboflavin synthase